MNFYERTFGKWTKDTKAVILPELVLITGLIPYYKMGKSVRFRVADVAAAIERMRVEEVGGIAEAGFFTNG